MLDTGVIPVPAQTQNFDEATVAARFGLRPALKPIRITQPQGKNFTIDGDFIEWQKWRFHVRFERRAGTVVSLVTYDGRQVMYQGSLAEVFVPYQDASTNWFYRTFMDEGEFGFGALSSPLRLGLDVPENAVLVDGLISAALPDPTAPVVPLPLPAVVGVFERVTGNPSWRHFEFLANNAYEGRAEVELVVRIIAQVGNYDYLIDWIFTQHGAIRVEVGLTGIDIPKGVRAKTLPTRPRRPTRRWGRSRRTTWCRPSTATTSISASTSTWTGATTASCSARSRPSAAKDSPRQSVWTLDEKVLAREKDAQLDDLDIWKVVSASRRNALGYPTGYVLESHSHAEPSAEKGRLPARQLHRARAVGDRVRCRRALRGRRHAQPEPGRAGPAAIRGRQRRASSTATSSSGTR